MIITAGERAKLRPPAPEQDKERLELNRQLKELERKLKTQGYQKSAKDKYFYARMDAGTQRFLTAEAATEAHHVEVEVNIKRVKLILAKMV